MINECPWQMPHIPETRRFRGCTRGKPPGLRNTWHGANALTWVRLQTRSVWLISESQNLKRESKSLILLLELIQRADFVTRAYTA